MLLPIADPRKGLQIALLDFHFSSHAMPLLSSSTTSPPQPEPEPEPDARSFVNQQSHISPSSRFYLLDGNDPNVEAQVVVQDHLIPPASTANNFPLEATTGQFNSTGAENQTIDIAAASDNEPDYDYSMEDDGRVAELGLLKSFKGGVGDHSFGLGINVTMRVYNDMFPDLSKYILCQSALKGDWERVESWIIHRYPYFFRAPITRNSETALHVAAGAKQTASVKKLVGIMTSADLTLRNQHGNTALCFAAASGDVRIAKLMVDKNLDLPLTRGFDKVTPLFMAVTYKRKEMVSYLLSVTDFDQLTPQEQLELLIATIHSDFYDISLRIMHMNNELATMKDAKNNETALHVMARKPSVISSRYILNFWERRFYSCMKGICHKKEIKRLGRQLVQSLWGHVGFMMPQKKMLEFIKHPTSLLHDAASAGNVEFLIILIRRYPDMVWEVDDDGKTIFHVAVENRLEKVLNLIHEANGLKDFSAKYRTTVEGKYNMLHLAAKLAAPNHLNRVSGAALQMQRELLWFKEVEKIVLPSQLEAKCDGPLKLTPRELFTKEHKDLRKDGEEWMKNTANSCMLVATLIATVVFAAAFTVPGGSDDNSGSPIFQQNVWFSVFVISDAAALVSSSTSILMFLSILTSRYAEDDFLHSLPSRLLFGLATLFISIVCLVVAFSATFFILYHKTNNWLPTTVAAMAIVPVSCFCALQFKLWVDTFHNTYLSRFLFKPRRRRLF